MIYTALTAGVLGYFGARYIAGFCKNYVAEKSVKENADTEEIPNDEEYDDEFCEEKKFSKREILFVCRRCENRWYMTKKEIRNAKATKRTINYMKTMRFLTLNVRKKHALTAEIALLQPYADYSKCPNCGSVNAKAFDY